MKKLAFIALNSQYIHTCLALQGLAELARPYGDVRFYEFTVNQDYRDLLMQIEPADEFFFSCYIWNRSFVLNLMQDLGRIYPASKRWVGGPEAQSDPASFLKVGQGVFLGEGETALQNYLAGQPVASLVTKTQTGQMARETRLDFPYPFDLVDSSKIVYYETQRGCPYHCSYCLSAEVNQLVDAPLDKVKADLKRLVASGAKLIKLVDRSFNAKSDRCLDLLGFFGRFPEPVTFHVELSPYGLNDAQIEAIAKLPPGRLQVEIGFQAKQARVLEAIDRPAYSAVTLERLEKLMALPIHRHIDLIAGLPKMSLGEVAETFDYLFSLRPDDLQVGFLKVLPGTPLARRQFEFGLVSSVAPPYEILRTPEISFSELNLLQRIASLAHWFQPLDYPTTFDYLKPVSPFAFYRRLVEASPYQAIASLEHRLQAIQRALGDELVKETMEIDYHRKRRHRKTLFFHDREVLVREILQGPLLATVQQLRPDVEDKKLNQRIAIYRTNYQSNYVMYDYATDTMEFLEE